MIRSIAILLAISLPLAAGEKVDLAVVNRIKVEAFQNSQAMDHLFYLSDVYGPRLTNSPGHKAAGEFVVKRLKEYGCRT
jgi:carboxypeptidase Q